MKWVKEIPKCPYLLKSFRHDGYFSLVNCLKGLLSQGLHCHKPLLAYQRLYYLIRRKMLMIKGQPKNFIMQSSLSKFEQVKKQKSHFSTTLGPGNSKSVGFLFNCQPCLLKIGPKFLSCLEPIKTTDCFSAIINHQAEHRILHQSSVF